MRFRLTILTLLRSPAKTLITFLLLFVTGFAFISRGAEYVATAGTVSSAEANYTALGTVQATPEYYQNGGYFVQNTSPAAEPLSAEAAELVLSSNYIASSEVRYVAAGTVSDGLFGVYEQPFDVLPYGSSAFALDYAAVIATCHGDGGADMYTRASAIGITVEEVVAGSDVLFPVGEELTLKYTNGDPLFIDSNGELFSELKKGERCFLVLTTEASGVPTNGYKTFATCVDYPLINLTRLEREHGVTDPLVALSDPQKYGLVESLYGVFAEGDPLADMYAGLSLERDCMPTLEFLEILDHNVRTSELAYTSDMSNLARFHNSSMYITEGRAITDADAENVCVVSSNYAAQNGLGVGDTIEFTVGADTTVIRGKVYAREMPFPIERLISEAFSDLGIEPVTQSYEIVGIWTDTVRDRNLDPYAYSLNTIFVPASTYPWADEVEPRLASSTFSFTLKHPGDVDRMQEELGDELAALGYELMIDDMGYAAAQHSLNMMKASALIGFVTMGAALVLALILITYLFIIRRKYDYAIMRALGVPAPQASRSLLVGLLTLSVAAVIVGCIAALVMTQNLSADLSAQLLEITGAEASAATPMWAIPAFGVGTLALLLVFAQIGLVRIGRKSPLALLQGGK